jgi:hypothetical protein
MQLQYKDFLVQAYKNLFYYLHCTAAVTRAARHPLFTIGAENV